MLNVTELRKVFGDFVAVDDVSFDAYGGEIFGLLGPNGAGKTTTIRVIATVLEATGGKATVAGFDIKKDAEKVRAHLGLLTSDIGLYDRFTARENLRYFGELYGMRGKELEDQIDELIDLLDMKNFADRRAGKFSTGMKQKVAIARSVIHDPDVIIFDEPTSGLDVLAAQTVIRFMKRMKDAGKLVVLSTHDMAHAQALCDRVAIIHRSKLIATGSMKEILATHNSETLEEAFIKIVGEDEVHAIARADEKKQFDTSRDITKKVYLSYLIKNEKGLRYASAVIVLAGAIIRSTNLLGSVSEIIGIAFLIVGVAEVLISSFIRKKYPRA